MKCCEQKQKKVHSKKKNLLFVAMALPKKVRDNKKYTYSYSFRIFFTEVIWFVTFFYGKSNLQNRPYFKYIDYACCKPKKKKVHRFLRARCKQKVNQPITSTPHLI